MSTPGAAMPRRFPIPPGVAQSLWCPSQTGVAAPTPAVPFATCMECR